MEEGEEGGGRTPVGCVVLSLGQNEVGKGKTSGRKSQQGLGWEDKGLEDIGEKPYCLSITIQHRRILSFKPRYLNGLPFSSAATLKRKLPVLSFLCLMKFTYQILSTYYVPGSPFGYFIPLSYNLELLEISISISTLNKGSHL